MRFVPAVVALVLALVVALAAFFAQAGVRDPDTARREFESGEALFARAIERFANEPDAAREDFRGAARAFATAMDAHPNAATAYNLGNAWLRAGDVGQAVAAYRRALLLSPGDTRVEQNLSEARRQMARSIAPPSPRSIDRARSAWAWLDGRAMIALSLWTIGFALVATAVVRADARTRWMDRAGAASIVAATLLGLTTVADQLAIRHSDAGVVGTSTILRKGNGDGFEPELAEPLPAGAECRILESRPGWTQIELNGPSRGWIRDDTLISVVSR